MSPDDGLPAAPAARYRERLAVLDPPTRARVETAARDKYLERAFAAGHDVATIERLAAEWSERGADWVRHNIGRLDAEPGRIGHGTGRFVQCDQRTCGPSTVVAARMVADPAFAHALSTRPPAAFGATQLTVHRAANLLWPRALGTTPAGIAATLNVHSGAFGTRYGWHPTTRTNRGRAISAATTAANHGWPVPLLLGDRIPRHWVLVLRGTDHAVTCYEPSAGRVVEVAAEDLRTANAHELGPPTLMAVVLPTRRI